MLGGNTLAVRRGNRPAAGTITQIRAAVLAPATRRRHRLAAEPRTSFTRIRPRVLRRAGLAGTRQSRTGLGRTGLASETVRPTTPAALRGRDRSTAETRREALAVLRGDRPPTLGREALTVLRRNGPPTLGREALTVLRGDRPPTLGRKALTVLRRDGLPTLGREALALLRRGAVGLAAVIRFRTAVLAGESLAVRRRDRLVGGAAVLARETLAVCRRDRLTREAVRTTVLAGKTLTVGRRDRLAREAVGTAVLAPEILAVLAGYRLRTAGHRRSAGRDRTGRARWQHAAGGCHRPGGTRAPPGLRSSAAPIALVIAGRPTPTRVNRTGTVSGPDTTRNRTGSVVRRPGATTRHRTGSIIRPDATTRHRTGSVVRRPEAAGWNRAGNVTRLSRTATRNQARDVAGRPGAAARNRAGKVTGLACGGVAGEFGHGAGAAGNGRCPSALLAGNDRRHDLGRGPCGPRRPDRTGTWHARTRTSTGSTGPSGTGVGYAGTLRATCASATGDRPGAITRLALRRRPSAATPTRAVTRPTGEVRLAISAALAADRSRGGLAVSAGAPSVVGGAVPPGALAGIAGSGGRRVRAVAATGRWPARGCGRHRRSGNGAHAGRRPVGPEAVARTGRGDGAGRRRHRPRGRGDRPGHRHVGRVAGERHDRPGGGRVAMPAGHRRSAASRPARGG
ncbi:hypothetical protein Ato02nite_095160 [Paractinoplanes toevensis]|uniref:Uncharacterized protein n=1 Tax=Paractinoplanes toevensis TaxID=571911 RepID=A0A920BR05_9ACTN|nr:hypothetical protein Ato02nite_095160 [Actinoplanes toevensis]